jgi:hypothetical protein
MVFCVSLSFNRLTQKMQLKETRMKRTRKGWVVVPLTLFIAALQAQNSIEEVQGEASQKGVFDEKPSFELSMPCISTQ